MNRGESRASPPTLYRSGRVYAPEVPGATAVVVHNRLVTYVGNDAGARAFASGAPEVDLAGRWLTPAFVDAHVHSVQTGQVLDGLDLGGIGDRESALAALATYVRRRPDRRVVIGSGWDERGWPDPRPPTRLELDRAGNGRLVYLARVDVHSAVASSALLDRVPAVDALPGWGGAGLVSREAHHACRRALAGLFTDAERRTAARAALVRAAEAGIGTVHELGGPHLGPVEDLVRVREVGAELGVEVVTYWGELAGADALARARFVGAAGLAGDLCIDGSLGSRTAALTAPYADAPYADAPYAGSADADFLDADSVSSGVRYLDADQITEHIVACTGAGLQAGFHCIGDDAVAAAVSGLRAAASRVGPRAIRARRHRLEHVEMLAEPDMDTLAELGVVASMQPAFDQAWGGPGRLYEARLGPARATAMNRLGTLHRRGVRLAFGSDSPVTPLAGWETVQAAVQHSCPGERLAPAAAFAAATRGGHAAAGDDQTGTIRVGARASLAIWEVEESGVDPNGLPDLRPGWPLPRCRGLVDPSANGAV